MIFVSPVKRITPLIVLVRRKMNVQDTVLNLSLAKDFGLFCFVFAAMGGASRPIKDASAMPGSQSFFTCCVMMFFNSVLSSF